MVGEPQRQLDVVVAHHSSDVADERVGDFGAAFVSVTIAFAIITLLLLTVGHPGRLAHIGTVRPAELLGGAGGAAVITVGLITIRTLGAGAVIALLVTAQLVIALLIDRFGWFGLQHVAIGPTRLLGLALVIGGTVLVTRI